MDDSSIYWTQQANEDQRPQFKTLKKPSSVEGGSPSIESLQPPPKTSSSSSSIYKIDDQHDSRREDNSNRFWQKEDITVAVTSRRVNFAATTAAFNQDRNLRQDIEHADGGNDINKSAPNKVNRNLFYHAYFPNLSSLKIISFTFVSYYKKL